MSSRARTSLIASAATLASLALAAPAHAATVAIGEQITNGNFTSNLSGWTGGGAAYQWRRNDNVINTAIGSAGFNGFFGSGTASGFAVLGDLDGNITNQPWQPGSTLEQSFVLATSIGGNPVTLYDLNISFRTAFDGRDSPYSTHDIFSAVLITPTGNITLFSQNSSGFPDVAPSTSAANNQLVNNPFATTLYGLLPGSYTLRFILDEAIDPSELDFTNTAAGIDAVSITGTANTVPLPAAAWLLLSGLAGLGVLGRRKAA